MVGSVLISSSSESSLAFWFFFNVQYMVFNSSWSCLNWFISWFWNSTFLSTRSRRASHVFYEGKNYCYFVFFIIIVSILWYLRNNKRRRRVTVMFQNRKLTSNRFYMLNCYQSSSQVIWKMDNMENVKQMEIFIFNRGNFAVMEILCALYTQRR